MELRKSAKSFDCVSVRFNALMTRVLAEAWLTRARARADVKPNRSAWRSGRTHIRKASFHGTSLSIGIESERTCGLINIREWLAKTAKFIIRARIIGRRLADESNVGVLTISLNDLRLRRDGNSRKCNFPSQTEKTESSLRLVASRIRSQRMRRCDSAIVSR